MRMRHNVFITGVAGFIGSNLAAALLKKGYHVAGLDNLSQGYKRNIRPFLKDKNFKFIEGDVRSETIVTRSSKGVNTIVHLATSTVDRSSCADRARSLEVSSHQ